MSHTHGEESEGENGVTHHLIRCREEGITRGRAFESLSIALVVGGSIVIPHLRRAVTRWTELEGRYTGG